MIVCSITHLRGDVVGERLRKEVAEVQHLDPSLAQRLRQRVVLLAGPLDPQDVVEQQLLAVGGRQPLELEAGAVQHDPPQAPHFGIDVQAHDPSPQPTATGGGTISDTGAGTTGTSEGGITSWSPASSTKARHFMNTYTGMPSIKSMKPRNTTW